jgi:hypothetical protein
MLFTQGADGISGGVTAVDTGIFDACTSVFEVVLFEPFPLFAADALPPVAFDVAVPPVAFPPFAVCDWF